MSPARVTALPSPDRSRLAWSGVTVAVPVVAGLLTLAMYATDPLIVAAAIAVVPVMMAIFRRPVVGVGIGILAVAMESAVPRLGGAGLSITEAMFLATAAAALLRWIFVAGRPQLPVEHAILLGLAASVLVGAIVAVDVAPVLRTSVMWASFAVASLVVANERQEVVKPLMTCIAVSGGIVGAIAIAGGGQQELVQGGAAATGRALGSFAHPNEFAYFEVLALPQAVVLARLGSPYQRIAAAIALPAIIGGLMLTLSRSGIIGGVVALLVLLSWSGFRRFVVGLLVMVAAYGLVNNGAIVRSPEVSIVSRRLSTVSVSRGQQRDPRFQIWKATPQIIYDHPLIGVGYRNFVVVSRGYGLFGPDGVPYNHAHNLFLNFAVEMGLLGLALFLALIAAVTRTARTAWTRAGPLRPLAISLTASLAGLLAAGTFDWIPASNAIWALVLFEIGALYLLSRSPEEHDRDLV